MIQVWVEEYTDGTVYTKLAHFDAARACRFASFEGGYVLEDARKHLLAAPPRSDIRPREDAVVLWHEKDRSTIAEFFQQKIDDIQADMLSKIIGADLYRYIVYILKFLELMSVQLGIRPLSDSVILGHEAGSDPQKQSELASVWGAKSTAWLSAVGQSEAAASTAKAAILAAKDGAAMAQIAEDFPAELKKVLV